MKNAFLALLLVLAIMAGGWLVSYFMNKSQNQLVEIQGHQQILDNYFNTAISFMQKKQYTQAVQQWRLFLAITPDVPEAHVNLGFSLYEINQPDAAAESFNRALQINPYQKNAYYGLAIYYEKVGDIKAALGAMRSFVHLSEEDEPFVRKAKAALWEWENKLKESEVATDNTVSSGKEP